jgi:acyl-coenzyme A thioesterase PaaI-like protein
VADVPEGYAPLVVTGGFRHLIGPIYRRDDADAIRLGLRIEAQHCNPNRMAHGGLLSAFADIVLSYTLSERRQPTEIPLTLSLTTEFIAAAPLGCWLEGCAFIKKNGGEIAFATCEIRADGALATQASGVFKFRAPRRIAENPARD